MMTRSSLRVWPLKASSYTAARRRSEISTSMPSVNGTLLQKRPCSSYPFHIVSILCSYELNLSAKDSPLKIIRHYHPDASKKFRGDGTLKVSAT